MYIFFNLTKETTNIENTTTHQHTNTHRQRKRQKKIDAWIHNSIILLRYSLQPPHVKRNSRMASCGTAPTNGNSTFLVNRYYVNPSPNTTKDEHHPYLGQRIAPRENQRPKRECRHRTKHLILHHCNTKNEVETHIPQ